MGKAGDCKKGTWQVREELTQNPAHPEQLTELIHVYITNTFSIIRHKAFYDQSAAWPSLIIRT